MLNIARHVLMSLGVMAFLASAPVHAGVNATGNTPASPEAQALKIYQSFRAQDYRAMYYLLAFTEKGKTMRGTVDQFALDVQKGYDESFETPEMKQKSDNILKSISDIMIGEPVITGNKAVVPTSARITVNNEVYTFKGQAFLIIDEGVWKLDLTFDEDSEKAMAQRTAELLGKPAT